MKPRAKVGIVLAGYAGAFLVAGAAFYVRMKLAADDPSSQGGMQAFGDMMLFILVFGLVGLLPTGLALYFLRPVRWFWTVTSLCALVLAATGVIAAVLFWTTHSQSPLSIAGVLSLQRILVTPLFILAFLIGAVFAPEKNPRWYFIFAAISEGLAAASWFVPAVLQNFLLR